MPTNNENRLDEALSALQNNDVPLELRQQHLAGLRKNHPELAPELDAALIARCCAQTQAIGALEEVIGKLKSTTLRLSGAPVREGVFIGSAALADGRVFARVVRSNGEALLNIADDELLASLEPGDRVLLTAEQNTVIGKCDFPSPGAGGECVQAERWLADGRLIVRHGDREHVVRAVARLTPENVRPGDTLRVDLANWLATEHIGAGETGRHAAGDEATSLPAEALAGYDDIRDGILRRIAYAVAHPEVAATYGMQAQRPWLLLGGPPGTGKTTLARVIAGMLRRETGKQCGIRKVNGAELLSPYVGETEQRIRSLVRDAGRSDGWSILFIDEVDAIARARGGVGNVHSDRFLSTWLSELEGFEGRANFVLVAATNRLEMLDAAFRSRFSAEILVPRPRMDAARAIFLRHLAADYPYFPGGAAAEPTRRAIIECALAKLYLPNVSGATIATLRFRDGNTRAVAVRELMSGRLVEQICVAAREHAFQRHIEGGASGICAEDLDSAVESARERLRLTLTPHNAHNYLEDLRTDHAVVAVDPAPRARASVSFLHPVAL